MGAVTARAVTASPRLACVHVDAHNHGQTGSSRVRGYWATGSTLDRCCPNAVLASGRVGGR